MKSVGLLAAVALIGAALLAPPPSQGHYGPVSITHPGGGGGSVRDHRWLTVCDWQVDGHKTYIRYRTTWPSLYPDDTIFFGYAPSRGCLSGGDPTGLGVRKFTVCIQWEGCTAVKDA
ncbi:MAG: hypothetical protein AABM43_09280 [Actinomycetota bacterium]